LAASCNLLWLLDEITQRKQKRPVYLKSHTLSPKWKENNSRKAEEARICGKSHPSPKRKEKRPQKTTETFRNLQEEASRASTVLVFGAAVMSSDAQHQTMIEAFEAGAADYLIKPIRRNEIVPLWQHVWRSRNKQRRLEPCSLAAAPSGSDVTWNVSHQRGSGQSSAFRFSANPNKRPRIDWGSGDDQGPQPMTDERPEVGTNPPLACVGSLGEVACCYQLPFVGRGSL
jgi:hypothetical protein